MAYTRELDATMLWRRLTEHLLVGLFFAWVSRGYLVRTAFRADITSAHIVQVGRLPVARWFPTVEFHGATVTRHGSLEVIVQSLEYPRGSRERRRVANGAGNVARPSFLAGWGESPSRTEHRARRPREARCRRYR